MLGKVKEFVSKLGWLGGPATSTELLVLPAVQAREQGSSNFKRFWD